MVVKYQELLQKSFNRNELNKKLNINIKIKNLEQSIERGLPKSRKVVSQFQSTMHPRRMFYSSSKEFIRKSYEKPLQQLKRAFKKQSNRTQTKDQKSQEESIKDVIQKIRIKRLKQEFYHKLTSNNIYEKPHRLELYSEKQLNAQRVIKLKGLKLHPYLLSVIYLIEIIFVIITFYLSTCLAFIPNFIEQKEQNHPISVGLKIATLIVCCLKIGIDSTTQTMHEGVQFTYITDILKAYVKSFSLLADLVYIVILIAFFFLSNQQSKINGIGLSLFICSVVKISICNKNLTYFQIVFLNSFQKEKYYKLFKVILFNIIFAHFIASMLLAMAAINDQSNWMISKGIDTASWHVQYMWSIYWATTIMMTVGFGDYTATTYKEALIIAFIEFFSCIVLAYNISQIGSIISALRTSQDEYIAKLGVFKRMAVQNSIKFETQVQIENYLREETAIKQRFEFNQQADLLESLPQPLKEKFIKDSMTNVFKRLPFFKDLHKKSLKNIAEIFKSRVCYPGQIISKANKYNKFINILKEGKAGLTYWKKKSLMNGVVVQQIQMRYQGYLEVDGQKLKYINNLSPILLNTEFLSPGKVMNYNTIALTYSCIVQLEVQQFIQIIKENQIDYQYFLSIIHQTSKWTHQWQQLPCDECSQDANWNTESNFKKTDNDQKGHDKIIHTGQKGHLQQKTLHYHTKFTCPRLHYLPKKSIITIRQNKISKPQKSIDYYIREKKRTQSCLLLHKKAFKLYEEYRVIKKQREVQTFLQQHESLSESSESSDKMQQENRNSFQFQRKKTRKHRDRNIDYPYAKNVDFEKNIYHFQKKNSLLRKYEETIENSSSSQDEPKQILKKVAQFSINKLYFERVSLVFWDLQIDRMHDFISYFPHENPMRLNQRKASSKNDQTPCMMWGILNYAKNLHKSKAEKKIQEPSISQESLDEISDNIYLRMTPFKESADKLNKNKTEKSLSSIRQQEMSENYPIIIKIPSSIKKFDDEFSIDEDSISIHLKKETKDVNNSLAELNDSRWK